MDSLAAGPSYHYLEHVPAAFAVVEGEDHHLVYANAAFRQMIGPGSVPAAAIAGTPLFEAYRGRPVPLLRALLDRARRTGVVARDRRVEAMDEGALLLSCTVWPGVDAHSVTQHLVIEMREASVGELTHALQREVAERLLMSALREQETASRAEQSSRRSSFLEAEARRLSESLDEGVTLGAMAGMAMPYVGDWCIVDTLDEDGAMHRLTIIHPDGQKQAALDVLEGRWIPHPGDPYGIAGVLNDSPASMSASGVERAIASGVHDADIVSALQRLGMGAMHTVPLMTRDHLIGAVTFVGTRHDRPFTVEDSQLAADLANRSAAALDRARAYGEAVALRIRADTASDARTAFLGMMSHELRTPLNAIGGYVDLIDMEIRGPVTREQHIDLGRIRSNQRYLLGLINDLLSFAKIGGGQLVYNITAVDLADVVRSTVALLEPLLDQKGIRCTCGEMSLLPPARADAEKVRQILINLISNGIKFTPAGGIIAIDVTVRDEALSLIVRDSGIGIPASHIEIVFDPFIQVDGGTSRQQGGVGLGLAISRGLARGMHGDLTAQSSPGEGAAFTLSLPRHRAESGSA